MWRTKIEIHENSDDAEDENSDEDNAENYDDDDDTIMTMMSKMTCGGGALLCVSIQIYAAWPGN